MQCACALLSEEACPALLYFFILFHKRNDFREEIIEHKTCFDFLYNCCLKQIFHSKKNSARYCHECMLVFMKTNRYFCHILITLESAREIFEKYTNIEFQENTSIRSRTVPCGRTGMTNQIVALCNFAIAPGNDVYRCSMYRSSDGKGTFVIWWKRRL
jgi:hypothetical protein